MRELREREGVVRELREREGSSERTKRGKERERVEKEGGSYCMIQGCLILIQNEH